VKDGFPYLSLSNTAVLASLSEAGEPDSVASLAVSSASAILPRVSRH
jgi:hypothetical protein